jgi:hypothetical protein
MDDIESILLSIDYEISSDSQQSDDIANKLSYYREEINHKLGNIIEDGQANFKDNCSVPAKMIMESNHHSKNEIVIMLVPSDFSGSEPMKLDIIDTNLSDESDESSFSYQSESRDSADTFSVPTSSSETKSDFEISHSSLEEGTKEKALLPYPVHSDIVSAVTDNTMVDATHYSSEDSKRIVTSESSLFKLDWKMKNISRHLQAIVSHTKLSLEQENKNDSMIETLMIDESEDCSSSDDENDAESTIDTWLVEISDDVYGKS